MRLAALLAQLPSDQLDRLVERHVGHEGTISRASLCSTLEGVLRSYSFVRNFIIDRQPPAFTILELLLDAEDHALALSGFREIVMDRTRVLAERVVSGEVVGREDHLRLYRRVFTEARRSDLTLDPSETAILGVLRHELGIRQVEHFLIEHHTDLQQFWNTGDAFLREMDALRSSGLVFAWEGTLALAEEVVPLVRQCIGIEMATADRQRLYERLAGAVLNAALGESGLRTSGSKDEKLLRVLEAYIQPSEVLRHVHIGGLRDLCRDLNCSVSGSKDDLVDRLVQHFQRRIDLQAPSDIPPPPPPEPKRLDDARFRMLFDALKSDDLTDVLAGIDSPRITGTKDQKVLLLWQSRFAETTLLSHLTNRSLEELLGVFDLKVGGAKRERIDRVVDYVAKFELASSETEQRLQ